MHKDIVEAIQLVCEEYNKRNEVFEVFIQRQETNGFWSMMIRVEKEHHYFIPHIEAIAIAIGRMFGESLYTEKDGNYLRLS